MQLRFGKPGCSRDYKKNTAQNSGFGMANTKKSQGYRIVSTVISQSHGMEPNFFRWPYYYTKFKRRCQQKNFFTMN
jgi:hypothetical protein